MPETLRSCIISEEGYTFLSLEASQVELRVAAHLSGDSAMIADLQTGDLHLATAVRMFGWTDDEEAMKKRRYDAKQCNFACIYGADEYKLAEMFNCPVEEATQFIEDHRKAYPRFYQWAEEQITQAKENGYVKSILGRIRPLPELQGGTWRIREKAEREVVNTLCQGCLAPEVRVLRADLRWIPVGDLKIGDRLIAFEEMPKVGYRGRKWKMATVINTGRITLPSYKITFDDGLEIIASTEHPWLTLRGKFYQHWLPTYKLRRGSRIAVPIPVWNIDNTRDGGYLASAFDSEGCLCQSKSGRSQGLTIQYTQTNWAIQNEIERILNSLGFDYSKYNVTYNSKGESRYSPGIEAWQYRIKGGFAENLRFLGQLRPVRLLEKFNMENCSRRMFSKLSRFRTIVKRGSLRWREVVALETDTRTYFVEGMPSHNTAIDIIKLAMIYLRERLDKRVRLVLNVHDEILWECPDELLQQSLEICQELEQAFPLYPFSIKVGKIYSQLKGKD